MELAGVSITNKGRELLSRTLAGEGKFLFTKGQLGEGKQTINSDDVTELLDPKLDLGIEKVENINGVSSLSLQITNKDLVTSFLTQEFGIFAKIEGDATEILYGYALADSPDTIPNNSNGVTFEAIQQVFLSIGSTTDASVEVNNSVLYLSLDSAQGYVKTGLLLGGELKSINGELLKTHQYKGDDDEFYTPVVDKFIWSGSGVATADLIKIDWKSQQEQIESLYEVKTHSMQLTGDGITTSNMPLEIIHNKNIATFQINGGAGFSASGSHGTFNEIVPLEFRPFLRAGADIFEKNPAIEGQRTGFNLVINENGTIDWSKNGGGVESFSSGIIVTGSYFIKQ